MKTYEDIRVQASHVDHLREIMPSYQDSGVCTAVAMAATLDIDFDMAIYTIQDTLGNRPGTFGWNAYGRCFEALGYRLTPFREYTAKTVTTLERDPFLRKGRFVVSVSQGRHAVALVDGKVIDWSEGRRHRIHRIWKIEEA